MKSIFVNSTIVRLIALCALALPLTACHKFLDGGWNPLGRNAATSSAPASSPSPAEKPSAVPPHNSYSDQPPQVHAPAADEKPVSPEIPSTPAPVGSPDSTSALASAGEVSAGRPAERERRPLLKQGDFNYENATLTEDVTWRGNVLVRGYLVIAPQATLRVEAGTVVRFMKSPVLRQSPRLVVMGRLHCSGTPERPALFASNFAEPASGDWGGILLLSSEKRNLLEHVRIEGAASGLEAHFSTLEFRGGGITGCAGGMLLRDSTATLSALTISGCETGLSFHDSEIELRESALTGNRRGIVARRSTLVLLAVTLEGSEQQGLTADECRVRIGSCKLGDNNGGATLSACEGQISRTRFTRNRQFGLQLKGSRIKVHNSLFAETSGDGIRVDDGRSVIWGSTFEGNSGYNLANNGREEISAVQNWWGSSREAEIGAKLPDSARDAGRGGITIFPWLPQKPDMLP